MHQDSLQLSQSSLIPGMRTHQNTSVNTYTQGRSFGLVSRTSELELGIIETDPLVWWEPLPFACHWWSGSRVWRKPGAAYAQRNIHEVVPFGGGFIMVWGFVSHDCKLELQTVAGNLTGPRYQQEILDRVVLPHSDDHRLLTRPVYMYDNAWPLRSRAVIDFLRWSAITTLPWPARSPDMNPIEHLWDIFGHRVCERLPPVQTLAQLKQTLHEEWRRLPQRHIQRLIHGMRKRVNTVIAVAGRYTRYLLCRNCDDYPWIQENL